MLVRVHDKSTSPSHSDILDEDFDPNIKLTPKENGVVVYISKVATADLVWFIPWNNIKFAMGTADQMAYFLREQDDLQLDTSGLDDYATTTELQDEITNLRDIISDMQNDIERLDAP